jgi:hypothetical protein
VGGLL